MKNAILLTIAIAVLTMLAPGGTARASNIIAAGDDPYRVLPNGIAPSGLDEISWLGLNNGPFSNLPASPAGFFGPGCDSFSGVIHLEGDPNFDTVVRRQDDANFPNPPGGLDSVGVEIVQFTLVSVTPINVNCGGPQDWDVLVTPDTASGIPGANEGQMDISHQDIGGGTAALQVPICFDFLFINVLDPSLTRTSSPCQEGNDPVTFTGQNFPWTHGGCPPEHLGSTNSDFCILKDVNVPFQGVNGSFLLTAAPAAETGPGTGTIIIEKVTEPPGLLEFFEFLANIESPSDTFGLAPGGSRTSTDLLPSIYNVQETIPEQDFGTFGFVVVITCDDESLPFVSLPGTPQVNIDLQEGETVTCTFTNKLDSDNDGVPDSTDDLCSGTSSSDPVDEFGCSDPQVDTDGDGVCNSDASSDGPFDCTGIDLCPDTPSNETPDINGCSSSQQATTGTVVIKKVTDPADSPGLFRFDHTIDSSGSFLLGHGGEETFLDVPPQFYAVEETPTVGLKLIDWTCVNSAETTSGQNLIASFFAEPGEITTCTFTNEPLHSKIDLSVEENVAIDGHADVVIKLDYPTLDETFPGAQITENLYASWLLSLDILKANKLAELGDDFARTDFDRAGTYLVGHIQPGALDKLQNNEHVLRVSLNEGDGSGHLADTVPLIDADQWHSDGITGEGVLVAVIDSGIDTDHPDLSDDLIFQECFGDNDGVINVSGFCPGGSDRRSGPGAAEDDESHGSHVTGTITSKGLVSPVGVAPGAEIVAIKVLDGANNFFYFSEILAALNFVIVNLPVAGGSLDVDLVNMSLGTNALFDGDCDASTAWNMAGAASVNTLRALGVTVFASSGNNGSNTSMSSPACLSNVVSVGATDDLDNVAAFTNSNASTDLMAPGAGVVSTDNTGSTAIKSGTSMASPHAVGCAALLIEAGVVTTPAEIEARLKNSSVQVSVGNLSFPRIDCRIPSDRPSVGGVTSFSSGSRSSSGSIALLAGGVAAVLAIIATSAWYTRRRWLRS